MIVVDRLVKPTFKAVCTDSIKQIERASVRSGIAIRLIILLDIRQANAIYAALRRSSNRICARLNLLLFNRASQPTKSHFS